MKTIEIMIRIPKDEYDYMIANPTRYNVCDDEKILYNYIKHGTVLPKGHTDLIDRQALIHSIEQKAKRLSNLDTINGLCGAVAIVFDAPTIIEADKDGQDGR